jgi:hypothetical protein
MSAQSQTSTPNEVDAALSYSQQGIPVFPTNPLDKKPLINGGFKNATTDENQIRDWWQRWPSAMIATPTGSASNMWVVDVDRDPVRNIDGTAALAKLISQHGELPPTLMTITPRGGRHLMFAWDNGVEIRTAPAKWVKASMCAARAATCAFPRAGAPTGRSTNGTPPARAKPFQHRAG